MNTNFEDDYRIDVEDKINSMIRTCYCVNTWPNTPRYYEELYEHYQLLENHSQSIMIEGRFNGKNQNANSELTVNTYFSFFTKIHLIEFDQQDMNQDKRKGIYIQSLKLHPRNVYAAGLFQQETFSKKFILDMKIKYSYLSLQHEIYQ